MFLIPHSPSLCVFAQSLIHVQLFATPWTVAHWAPLSIGFLRQENRSGLPSPPPGDLPKPGINPRLLRVLHWQADSLSLSHLGRFSYYLDLPFMTYGLITVEFIE